MTPESKKIELFQDLFLTGPREKQTQLRKALLSHVTLPWSHAEDKERSLSKTAGASGDILAFECRATRHLTAATLWLWSQPDGYKVTNIVPLREGELGFRKYNNILHDFENKIAIPAAQETGFNIRTTPSYQSLDDWLPTEAAKALRKFSRSANKSTGSAHPLDRQRWFDFIILAHADNGKLGTDLLARWLTEVEGWEDEEANELSIEYEFGLRLLEQYDLRRQ